MVRKWGRPYDAWPVEKKDCDVLSFILLFYLILSILNLRCPSSKRMTTITIAKTTRTGAKIFLLFSNMQNFVGEPLLVVPVPVVRK